jgi:hypothetical protein
MGGLLTLPAFEEQFPQTAGGFGTSTSATLQSLLIAICKSGLIPRYTYRLDPPNTQTRSDACPELSPTSTSATA